MLPQNLRAFEMKTFFLARVNQETGISNLQPVFCQNPLEALVESWKILSTGPCD